MRVDCVVGFSTYNNTGNDNTTGELLLPAVLGMSGFTRVVVNQESGYQIEVLYSESGPTVDYPTPIRFKVLSGSGGGATSLDTAGTPAGTITAPSLASTPIVVEGPTLRLYIFNASGAFQVGETVTGGTSGSTAVVDSVTADYLVVSGVAVDIFTATETITGSITGVTATVLGSVCYAWDVSGNSIVNQSIFTFRALGGSDFDLIPVSPFDIAYVDLFGSLSGNFVMHDYANEVVLGPTFSLSTLYNECLFVALASTTSVPVFAGNQLAAHNHTVAGGASLEVPNGTDLSVPLGSVQVICYGV